MKKKDMELGLDLLDHQLVDSKGRLCGKVDDVEIKGEPGKNAKVVALLSGADAWLYRLPDHLEWLVRKFLKKPTMIRIPIEDIEEAKGPVILKKTAKSYGLGKGDDVAAEWLKKIPGL